MIRIETEYFTEAGLVVDVERHGRSGWLKAERVLMRRVDYGLWTAGIGNARPGEQLRWRMSVVERGRQVRSEAACHYWTATGSGDARLRCLWRDGSDRWGGVEPSEGCFAANSEFRILNSERGEGGLELRVRRFGRGRVVVCGSSVETGCWDVAKALEGRRTGVTDWVFRLGELPQEYKYVVIDEAGAAHWEEGWNRQADCAGMSEERPRLAEEPCRLAGIVVPLFSLRSERSWGVGDFGDLRKLVDVAQGWGLRVVQLLPVVDTTRTGTWEDSYPYSGVSVFALHPLYMDLSGLSGLDDSELEHALERERRELNALPQLDYEGAFRLKLGFIRRVWAERRKELWQAAGLREFVRENGYWLESYACFKVLQRRRGTSDYERWGNYSEFKPGATAEQMRREGMGGEIELEIWMQYELARQLAEVHAYAAARGVMLKGDIPIGVNKHSAEAWAHRDYFNFDGQAGAPPDYFAAEGQNWGFPTYRWDAILRDGGLWWKERLRVMSRFFDAYRIDHVLGFFRIWEIPTPYIYGTLGHFEPCRPLSGEELAQAGFGGDEVELYSEAWFTDEELQGLFGGETAMALVRFFERRGRGRHWRLKERYLSQRSIVADTLPGRRRQALLGAVCNVLFMRLGEGWVPNIAGLGTPAFRRLGAEQQGRYRALHADFFYRRHNEFWVEGALEKLRLVTEATGMLACAEDLGMIPDTMRLVLDRLQILSLEVETMPKEGGRRFQDVMKNPERSVDTITTHDMPPLRLWWLENEEARQAYFNEVLGGVGRAPDEAGPDLCRRVVQRHLGSPSCLCVIALQDWLAMDVGLRGSDVRAEQVNKPSVPNHYWRYRMHLTLERLEEARAFGRIVARMVRNAGR